MPEDKQEQAQPGKKEEKENREYKKDKVEAIKETKNERNLGKPKPDEKPKPNEKPKQDEKPKHDEQKKQEDKKKPEEKKKPDGDKKRDHKEGDDKKNGNDGKNVEDPKPQKPSESPSNPFAIPSINVQPDGEAQKPPATTVQTTSPTNSVQPASPDNVQPAKPAPHVQSADPGVKPAVPSKKPEISTVGAASAGLVGEPIVEYKKPVPSTVSNEQPGLIVPVSTPRTDVGPNSNVAPMGQTQEVQPVGRSNMREGTSQSRDDGKLSTMGIVGIVAGSLSLVLIVVVMVFYFKRRKRLRDMQRKTSLPTITRIPPAVPKPLPVMVEKHHSQASNSEFKRRASPRTSVISFHIPSPPSSPPELRPQSVEYGNLLPPVPPLPDLETLVLNIPDATVDISTTADVLVVAAPPAPMIARESIIEYPAPLPRPTSTRPSSKPLPLALNTVSKGRSSDGGLNFWDMESNADTELPDSSHVSLKILSPSAAYKVPDLWNSQQGRPSLETVKL